MKQPGSLVKLTASRSVELVLSVSEGRTARYSETAIACSDKIGTVIRSPAWRIVDNELLWSASA